MCAFHVVLALLLLGALRAFPQGRAPTDPCAGDPNLHYNKAVGRCCYRCPVGLSPTQLCPQGSSDCRKQCEPDYYLDRDNRCTACVSCSRRDLVEKKPCSWNSPRVCECRAGMFCDTSATNSCARCSLHAICSKGMIVKFPGTAERNTVCESPSPGTRGNCSTSPEDCKAPASGTTSQAKPILTSASSDASTMPLGRDSPLTPEDDSKMMRAPNSLSPVGKPRSNQGLSPQQLCPLGSTDCRKQCEPDYYLGRDGRCTACVSCSGDDLVEKTPCTWNSSRVCECRPGMFCVTSATNSCARCIACPTVPPGTATECVDITERDTTYEPPLPEIHLKNCTNSEESKAPTSTSPCRLPSLDSQAIKGDGGSATHGPWDASISTSVPISFSSTGKPILGASISTSVPISFSSTGRPILVSGPVFLWVFVALLVVISSGSFLLCQRRACWKWMQQSSEAGICSPPPDIIPELHLCYPVQTFRPEPEPVDSRPGRNQIELKSVLEAKPCTEELGLVSPPAVETCPSVRATCPENLPLLGASSDGSPSSPRDLPEPRVTTEHTNNRIEKIYIMKADTVIVGTVKTEVPEGRGFVGPMAPALEEELEVDHTPHYPEQETEPPVGSSGDVMFSVEEEGKEDPLPTTASGK